MSQLPEKVLSHYPPTILQTPNGKYVVFEIAGEWYEVDDTFTEADALKHWKEKTEELPVEPETVKSKETSNIEVKRIAIQRWEKESNSDPSKLYEIIKYDDDTYSCNCPSYIFKKEDQERDCKHIRELQQTQ